MAQSYSEYKRKAEKLGAKQIATPEEYAKVQRRLDAIYKPKRRRKQTAASLLTSYARRAR